MGLEYAITLTYRCNWSCPYCAVRNSVDWKPSLSREGVLEKLGRVENGSTVTLFGGEPGILPRSELEEYIRILSEDKGCTLKLETNGLFIRNYPDLLPIFSKVTYHCSQDLAEDDEIAEVSAVPTDYMLVIHDGNIGRLGRFLETHPFPSRFYAVEATYPHETTGPTLSKTNKHKLMTRFCGRLTEESVKRLVKGEDFSHIIFMT